MFQPISKSGKLFKRYLLAGRHASKVRIQNLLGEYFFSDGIRVKTESGTIFKLNPNDWLSRELLLHDGYENSSVNLAKKLVKDGGSFIDIGANFGLYTCAVSENTAVHVFAIEPNYMVVPMLVENVQMNKRDNVSIINTALSGSFNFVSLELPQSHNLGSASFTIKNEGTFSILSCSLNYLFQSQGITSAELIKIDIEGNEFEVFKDFSFETFPVRNILMEFNHLSGISFAELSQFFSDKGFSIKDINGKLIFDTPDNLPENNLWLVNLKYPV